MALHALINFENWNRFQTSKHDMKINKIERVILLDLVGVSHEIKPTAEIGINKIKM